MAKLLVIPCEEWLTHEKSGAQFLIKPIEPARYRELREACRDAKGEVDFIKFCTLAAPEAIGDWKDVGSPTENLPADKPTLEAFARHHATDLMPWVLDEAQSLDRSLPQKKEAAKKD
jgi:hypothetical protein